LKTPTFITGHNSLEHFTSLVSKLNETATTFNPMLCPTGNESGTNLEEIFLFYKSLSKIFLVASLPTPMTFSEWPNGYLPMARVFSTFSLDRAKADRLGRE